MKRQEPPPSDTPGVKTLHNLMLKADGPYPIVNAMDNTVAIILDGMTEKVSRNRIAEESPPKQQPQSARSTLHQSLPTS